MFQLVHIIHIDPLSPRRLSSTEAGSGTRNGTGTYTEKDKLKIYEYRYDMSTLITL